MNPRPCLPVLSLTRCHQNGLVLLLKTMMLYKVVDLLLLQLREVCLVDVLHYIH